MARMIAAVLLGAALGWWLSPRGEAPTVVVPNPDGPVFSQIEVPPPGWTEPYGRCKEAYTMPHSDAADECRRYGRIK